MAVILSPYQSALSQRPHGVCPALRGRGFQQQRLPKRLWGNVPTVVMDKLPGLGGAGGWNIPIRFEAVSEDSAVSQKPLNIGLLFSGGPAAGGHNVAAGIFDFCRQLSADSRVLGLTNGPNGLLDPVKNQPLVLTDELIGAHRNLGGFNLLGTSRTKIETPEDFALALQTMKELSLDGLVIIGGDDSNTNAAFLADYFLQQQAPFSVVGVPKTIDGDLAFNPYVPISFGFDTAVRGYADSIASICQDACSSRKLWHFIKLMGRSASWITLGAALETQPNIALIGEEIKAGQLTLDQVVDGIVTAIKARKKNGKNYGVCVIPEGIVEFIPEVKKLIGKINDVVDSYGRNKFQEQPLFDRKEVILARLGAEKDLFCSFPEIVQRGLLEDLDPHGNVQVSRIPSEVLLMEMVRKKLRSEGIKQEMVPHFFGYEERCTDPSGFDANYTYNLGRLAAMMIGQKVTGCMAALANLHLGLDQWLPLAVPLPMMMGVEQRKGEEVTVISKALIDTLTDAAFLHFKEHRDEWAREDCYRNPGPICHFGPSELTDVLPMTLELNGETVNVE